MSGNNENSEESLVEENRRLVEAYEELDGKHEKLKDEYLALKEEHDVIRLWSGEAENHDLHTLLREAIGEKEGEPLHRLVSYSRYLNEKLPPYQDTQYVAPDGGGGIYVAPKGRKQFQIGMARANYEARAGVCLTYEEKENFIDKFRTWYELNRAHRNKLIGILNGIRGGYDETKLTKAKERKLKAEEELKKIEAGDFNSEAFHVERRKRDEADEEMTEILKLGTRIENLTKEIEVHNRKLGN